MSTITEAQIAWKGELEFLAATEDDRTGRTVQFRIIRKLDEMGMAHPFNQFTRRRRGHAGTRFQASFAELGTAKARGGEIMLLNWADGPKGATVKFLLDVAEGDHPFMHCTRRTPDAAGTTFIAVLLELDDDDVVVNQAKRERHEKAQQKLSNVAAMMVKYPRFHEWLRETRWGLSETNEPITTTRADTWLKTHLDISSKAELDGKNIVAARKFLELRAAYCEWLDANKFDRE